MKCYSCFTSLLSCNIRNFSSQLNVIFVLPFAAFAILSLVQSAPGITKGIFGDIRIFGNISFGRLWENRGLRTVYSLKYFCLLPFRGPGQPAALTCD